MEVSVNSTLEKKAYSKYDRDELDKFVHDELSLEAAKWIINNLDIKMIEDPESEDRIYSSTMRVFTGIEDEHSFKNDKIASLLYKIHKRANGIHDKGTCKDIETIYTLLYKSNISDAYKVFND